MVEKKQIAFVLAYPSVVPSRKRIRALRALGVEPRVYSFERINKGANPEDMDYIGLGKVTDGRYWRRLVPLVASVPKVRRALKETGIVYVFGLDLLVLAWLASCGLRHETTIVYEVHDVTGVQIRDGLFSRLLRKAEQYLLRRVSVLVVSSQAYVDAYYKGMVKAPSLDYLVIENKLEPIPSPCGNKRRTSDGAQASGAITIGYFGVLRCRDSWEALKRIGVDGKGRFRIYARGYPSGIENFDQEAKQLPFVEYEGPFQSPSQLAEIYGQVDIVWAAHYHARANTMWARSNRFYESCCFGKPMVAQMGTQDGKIVEAKSLGMCIDLVDIDHAVQQVLQISREHIERWAANVKELPHEVYFYSGEHQRLLERLGIADEIQPGVPI